MNRNNMLGLITVAILIVIVFIYIDFFASSPALPETPVATSTSSGVSTTTSAGITVATTGTTTLALHDERKVGDTIFVPAEIVEDSRCPIDVQCIQAGKVVVLVRFSSLEKDWSVQMEPGDSVQSSDFTLTMNSVDPARTSGSNLHDEDYRFLFTIGT